MSTINRRNRRDYVRYRKLSDRYDELAFKEPESKDVRDWLKLRFRFSQYSRELRSARRLSHE